MVSSLAEYLNLILQSTENTEFENNKAGLAQEICTASDFDLHIFKNTIIENYFKSYPDQQNDIKELVEVLEEWINEEIEEMALPDFKQTLNLIVGGFYVDIETETVIHTKEVTGIKLKKSSAKKFREESKELIDQEFWSLEESLNITEKENEVIRYKLGCLTIVHVLERCFFRLKNNWIFSLIEFSHGSILEEEQIRNKVEKDYLLIEKLFRIYERNKEKEKYFLLKKFCEWCLKEKEVKESDLLKEISETKKKRIKAEYLEIVILKIYRRTIKIYYSEIIRTVYGKNNILKIFFGRLNLFWMRITLRELRLYAEKKIKFEKTLDNVNMLECRSLFYRLFEKIRIFQKKEHLLRILTCIFNSKLREEIKKFESKTKQNNMIKEKTKEMATRFFENLRKMNLEKYEKVQKLKEIFQKKEREVLHFIRNILYDEKIFSYEQNVDELAENLKIKSYIAQKMKMVELNETLIKKHFTNFKIAVFNARKSNEIVEELSKQDLQIKYKNLKLFHLLNLIIKKIDEYERDFLVEATRIWKMDEIKNIENMKEIIIKEKLEFLSKLLLKPFLDFKIGVEKMKENEIDQKSKLIEIYEKEKKIKSIKIILRNINKFVFLEFKQSIENIKSWENNELKRKERLKLQKRMFNLISSYITTRQFERFRNSIFEERIERIKKQNMEISELKSTILNKLAEQREKLVLIRSFSNFKTHIFEQENKNLLKYIQEKENEIRDKEKKFYIEKLEEISIKLFFKQLRTLRNELFEIKISKLIDWTKLQPTLEEETEQTTLHEFFSIESLEAVKVEPVKKFTLEINNSETEIEILKYRVQPLLVYEKEEDIEISAMVKIKLEICVFKSEIFITSEKRLKPQLGLTNTNFIEILPTRNFVLEIYQEKPEIAINRKKNAIFELKIETNSFVEIKSSKKFYLDIHQINSNIQILHQNKKRLELNIEKQNSIWVNQFSALKPLESEVSEFSEEINFISHIEAQKKLKPKLRKELKSNESNRSSKIIKEKHYPEKPDNEYEEFTFISKPHSSLPIKKERKTIKRGLKSFKNQGNIEQDPEYIVFPENEEIKKKAIEKEEADISFEVYEKISILETVKERLQSMRERLEKLQIKPINSY